MEQHERKVALRRSARAARRAMSTTARRDAAAAIRRSLLLLPELATARTVLLYAANPSEVDVDGAAGELRARGVTTLYPRVRDDELECAQVSDPSALQPGHRGIREPTGPACELTALDAVVIPGVAFDLRGGRLGQGGGHYDRLLASLGDTLRIGVAFACQVVPSVPRAAHDAAIDVLITEQSVQRIDEEPT